MSKQYARRDPKADPKGDRRSRTISPPVPPVQTYEYHLTERGEAALNAMVDLADLLMRGDGWVRMTSSLDMKTVYLKYKYNHGQWKGCYVMVVATLDQLAWAVSLLHYKLQQVERAELRPSQDTFYDWKD
jgi:hypothetical protein